jgi:hypothetical protein
VSAILVRLCKRQFRHSATATQPQLSLRYGIIIVIRSLFYIRVRVEFFTAVTMKNCVFWDVNAVWLL